MIRATRPDGVQFEVEVGRSVTDAAWWILSRCCACGETAQVRVADGEDDVVTLRRKVRGLSTEHECGSTRALVTEKP